MVEQKNWMGNRSEFNKKNIFCIFNEEGVVYAMLNFHSYFLLHVNWLYVQ